jgi:hypothetical protein
MGKLITLSNGQEVEVQPVPPLALSVIGERNPVPENLDAEQTQAAMSAQDRLVNEAAWLMALGHVEVPEDWQFPRGLTYAGIQPREGDAGRVLDYIEYGLLVTTDDLKKVQQAMYGDALTESEVDAAEAIFPNHGGQPTAAEDPGE